jgi:hypothetical protein
MLDIVRRRIRHVSRREQLAELLAGDARIADCRIGRDDVGVDDRIDDHLVRRVMARQQRAREQHHARRRPPVSHSRLRSASES